MTRSEQSNNSESQASPSRRSVNRRRSSNARRSRRGAANNNGGSSGGTPMRRIPAYNLLDEEALVCIEQQADWILSNVGVEFREDEEAIKLFEAAGASVDGQRIKFDPGHARQLCSTAPDTFQLHARDSKNTITLGGDHVVFMPGYGSPFVTDLDQGRRYASLKDFENFVKLSQSSAHLHHLSGTVCEPVDVPVNKRHLDMVYTHLRHGSKPFMGGVTSESRAKDSIDMARIVFGANFLHEHAVIQANINVNSPLVYDATMSSSLRAYAMANQCVAVSPSIFGGAMGPVDAADIAAQTLAEGMVGIALAQLIKPGCPCVLGSFHSTMSLKSGALTFGSPEANLVNFALSQLGRRLGVPVRSGGGQITSANSVDAQAMMEGVGAMWSTVLSGSHQIWHAAGWLEGGLTMSYEKFVIDLDHCGMLLRMIQGMNVSEEGFARSSYEEVGPGGNHLSTSDTMAKFRDAYYLSSIPEAGPFETWTEAGSPSAEQRANKVWKEMLHNFDDPGLDCSIDDALKDFMARRKQEMPDAWY